MIWCIKTYIIAYVKTQKNKIYYPMLLLLFARHVTPNRILGDALHQLRHVECSFYVLNCMCFMGLCALKIWNNRFSLN